METLKRWYVMVAVIGFTVFLPVAGKTPLQWGLQGLQMLVTAVSEVAS